MANPPSIVGTWITSFIAWHKVGAGSWLVPFVAANDFWFNWVSPPPPHHGSIVDGWLNAWESYEGNPDNKPLVDLLELIAPAPLATLSRFKFNSDFTLTAWVRWNQQQNGMAEKTYPGNWATEFDAVTGTQFGTIWLNEIDPDTGAKVVHATLQYLFVTPTEISFIIAHGGHRYSYAPSGAGTMRLVQY